MAERPEESRLKKTRTNKLQYCTLTFRGTEKFAVRMMASAIACAYQGWQN